MGSGLRFRVLVPRRGEAQVMASKHPIVREVSKAKCVSFYTYLESSENHGLVLECAYMKLGCD